MGVSSSSVECPTAMSARILLLTDIPPSEDYTAGLVLAQMCRLLPRGSVACFLVLNPAVHPRIPNDLSWIPIQQTSKPRENWNFGPRMLRTVTSFVGEAWTAGVRIPRISRRIVEFGSHFGANKLWCILQGQTLIRLSRSVARKLRIDLYTQIWDPPEWWLRAHTVDKISTRRIRNAFKQALWLSTTTATASWAMGKYYQGIHGVSTVPILPSLPRAVAVSPAKEVNEGTEFVIGLAGQLYAIEEWNALLNALSRREWKIGERGVRIRVFGRSISIESSEKMRIEFLGWHTQLDTIRLLSQTDVLYCPYWFDPVFELESRLSFPSKLTTYLAAGRPVFFHGPEYASPATFLRDQDSAVFCHSLESGDIVTTLEKVLTNKALYARTALNGSRAFHKYLTLESMKTSLVKFLGLDSLHDSSTTSEEPTTISLSENGYRSLDDTHR